MAWIALLFYLAPVLSLTDTGSIGIIYILVLFLPTLFLCPFVQYYNLKGYFFIAITLWIFSIISSCFGVSKTLYIESIIKYLLFDILFIILTGTRYDVYDLKLILKGIIYVSFVIGILFILSWIFNVPYSESYYNLGRYSINIIGIQKNPNYLTAVLNVSNFILTYCLSRNKNSFTTKLKILFLVVINFIAIVLSGTRAALILSLFLMLSVYLYSSNFRKLFKLIILLILGVFSLVYLYFDEINMFLDFYLAGRSFTEDPGREETWRMAFDVIKRNWLFGGGLYAFEFIKPYAPIDALHNLYLEVLLNQGLIGIVLFIFLLFYKFNQTKRQDRFFLIFLIISSGAQMIFQNGFVDAVFWRFLILNRIAINFSIYNDTSIVNSILRTYKN